MKDIRIKVGVYEVGRGLHPISWHNMYCEFVHSLYCSNKTGSYLTLENPSRSPLHQMSAGKEHGIIIDSRTDAL